MPRHTIIIFLKTNNKEEILKVAGGGKKTHYKKERQQIFHWKKFPLKDSVATFLKLKICQPKILCSTKYLSKKKAK